MLVLSDVMLTAKEVLKQRQKRPFALEAPFPPAGDQPQAIVALTQGLERHERNQILMGVTGSGKTYTMAQVIQNTQRTSLILAPNKTLAAQLFGEMKAFFPHNAVEYFVSYYDYYRPESYIAKTNTFIKKEATINENIERMRHSATRSLLQRTDVIVVASVSCIYGLGSLEAYHAMALDISVQDIMPLPALMRTLAGLAYRRNDIEFTRGSFRLRGDRLDIFPAHYENRAWSLCFFGSTLEEIHEIDVVTGQRLCPLESVKIYPNNHYITPGPTMHQAIGHIRKELKAQVSTFQEQEKWLEAQRLQERVTFDLEALTTSGICSGIENYSCYLTNRALGLPPPTLLEYLPSDALLIVDESHVAVPQLNAMYAGDASRKKSLVEHGFRLPSCVNNRPLKFQEWDEIRPETIFVSATPGPWELEQGGAIIEQIIRPTGLLDPVCHIEPCAHQMEHLSEEIRKVIKDGGRILVTTLTKRMAEDLSEYFLTKDLKARYMHADVETLDRIQLIADLRHGEFDILIGINLLREGLDIPECQLVAILDADREGYLRSKTSLIQTMGRAARNLKGRVILYADHITGSMAGALEETHRRRDVQHAHNLAHNFTPRSVGSPIVQAHELDPEFSAMDTPALEAAMLKAAEDLDFERAAMLKRLLQGRLR